ncbi:MAG: FAD:protein FMN transferase [Chloroflexota bacterium]|nr:FAD:protein FMN transferase [Chloroflexota bacterium]
MRTASTVAMDTIITIAVDSSPDSAEAVGRALGWFVELERVCSRFDPASELFRLSQRCGAPIPVSRLLFEVVGFALKVTEATDGLFDPTLGADLARRGFDRNYRTGQRLKPSGASAGNRRDVVLDPARQTITLRRPLLLDLGAVVKGLAIDLAARELSACSALAIDAGGDVLVKGQNGRGEPWLVGIAHPRRPGALIASLRLTAGAVCTSGDYERRATDPGRHHLLDPRTRTSANAAISCTVVAASAAVADALSTAAFVAGPKAGVRLLEAQEVDGMLVGPDLRMESTRGFDRWLAAPLPSPGNSGLA